MTDRTNTPSELRYGFAETTIGTALVAVSDVGLASAGSGSARRMPTNSN